jgi:hypothetical protein
MVRYRDDQPLGMGIANSEGQRERNADHNDPWA